MDFCGNQRKKGPVESQEEHEQDIDNDAEAQRQVAVMGRDRRNPVDEHSIERESGHKTQEKGLLRLFFQDNGQKRNEGDPSEKGKIELRIRKSCQDSAQRSQRDINDSALQYKSPSTAFF